jgi:hypothetical protein
MVCRYEEWLKPEAGSSTPPPVFEVPVLVVDGNTDASIYAPAVDEICELIANEVERLDCLASDGTVESTTAAPVVGDEAAEVGAGVGAVEAGAAVDLAKAPPAAVEEAVVAKAGERVTEAMTPDVSTNGLARKWGDAVIDAQPKQLFGASNCADAAL